MSYFHPFVQCSSVCPECWLCIVEIFDGRGRWEVKEFQYDRPQKIATAKTGVTRNQICLWSVLGPSFSFHSFMCSHQFSSLLFISESFRWCLIGLSTKKSVWNCDDIFISQLHRLSTLKSDASCWQVARHSIPFLDWDFGWKKLCLTISDSNSEKKNQHLPSFAQKLKRKSEKCEHINETIQKKRRMVSRLWQVNRVTSEMGFKIFAEMHIGIP